MDLDGQIKLGHLLLNDRKCRTCGEIKNLIEGFYRTRRDRGPVASSYSYECKDCTIKRVMESKKKSKDKPDIPYDPVPRFGPDIYPDW